MPTGLLVTDGESAAHLCAARRDQRLAQVSAPSLGTVGGRPMLGGLKLMLVLVPAAQRRARAGACRRCSKRAATRRPRSRPSSPRRCSARCTSCCAASTPPTGRGSRLWRRADREHLYEGLLTVLLRLVFLLYAEDRDLIPSRTDGEARALYEQGYRRPHALCAPARRCARIIPTRWTSGAAPGAGCWRCSGSSIAAIAPAGSAARGGKLFDPEAFPFLQGQDEADPSAPAPAAVSDGCILRILEA